MILGMGCCLCGIFGVFGVLVWAGACYGWVLCVFLFSVGCVFWVVQDVRFGGKMFVCGVFFGEHVNVVWRCEICV